MATFSVEPVFLLWSREGSDNRPGAWYEPNHFVPLYSAEVGDGIDALVDSKTYDTKPSPVGLLRLAFTQQLKAPDAVW